jgi:hypothetical protein
MKLNSPLRVSRCVCVFGVFGLLAAFSACGGNSEKTQKTQPVALGQRGETCQARNDCAAGLACINGVCSKNDFDIAVSAKHCDQVDCQGTVDCCGNKPLAPPAECANRDAICTTPTLPGCVASNCTSDASCGAGTCGQGFCSLTSGACSDQSDCLDTCDGSFCTLSFFSCTSAAQCYGQGTCSGRFCDCTNPAYDPFNPICSNPDCVDVCTLRCEDERCVQDTTCETDIDCLSLGSSICDAGRCVDCLTDDDCDATLSEACVAGRCKKPCMQNEECPLFHQCQGGECVETGCTSDRECVLAASQGIVGGGEDARLSKCLPSDTDPALMSCKVPCENDGACGSQFQVCEAGFCKFVGCETDEECRSYLGLANETTDTQPFIPQAVCRE